MDRDYQGEELKRWLERVKADRGDWDNLYEDIATFILPSQKNFEVRLSQGQERMDGVYDGTAIYANERLAANLHFLATNPATPWFNLKFRDEALNESDDAVKWLEECADLFKDALNDSNFDSVIGEFWLALPAFGTAPIAVEETAPEYGPNDPNKFYGFNFQSNHLARCWGVPGPDGTLRDTFTEYELNARQAVEKFGAEKLSEKIKEAFEKSDFTTTFTFCHSVYKRLHLKAMPDQEDAPADKRMFASVHFETHDGNVADEGGYYEQMRFMGRWRKRSDDDYGYGIGEKVLPDVKTLNEAKALWFAAVEKMIDNPVLMEDNNLVGQIELGSRGVTYVRSIAGVQFWEQPTSGFQVADMTFEELKSDIREAYFWDRLDLPPSDAGDMTAYEFGKRLQRAMQLFGPTLGRLYREALNGLIQRGFNIMYRKKAFPAVPKAVLEAAATAGNREHVDIEYDNPFARAQKSEVVDAIDMYVGDMLNVSAGQTNAGQADTVLDLIDMDEYGTHKARTANIPEKMLRTTAKVTKLREERAARMQQQREAELAAQEAETLSTASKADVGKLKQLAAAR